MTTVYDDAKTALASLLTDGGPRGRLKPSQLNEAIAIVTDALVTVLEEEIELRQTESQTNALITTAINDLKSGATSALDSLNELAAAIGNDANYAASIATALSLKAPVASPAFTGTPTAPTVAGTADSTTKIATTAFVQAVLATIGAFVIASQAEAEAGAENTKGMTALRTAQAITARTKSAKAYCKFSSSGVLQTGSFGITSVSRSEAGRYIVTLSVAITNPMPVANCGNGMNSYVESATGGASPVIVLRSGIPSVSFNDADHWLAVFGE
jgi:hypothetical protein